MDCKHHFCVAYQTREIEQETIVYYRMETYKTAFVYCENCGVPGTIGIKMRPNETVLPTYEKKT